jgi:hypothetical protein
VVWLLELELGSGTHLYAVEDVSVASRLAGGDVRYSAGLTVPDTSPDTDSVSLSVRVSGLADIVALALTLTGRRASLRAYRGESFVEDARALVGQMGGVVWGEPGDEELLQFSIERPGVEAGDALCDPGDVISTETMTGWNHDEDRDGEVMPIVIGCPGRLASVAATRAAGVVPAIIVDTTGGHKRILVAAHRVEATAVDFHNITDPALSTTNVPIIYEADNTGRVRALINNAGPVLAIPGDAIWTGWQAAYGGGVQHRGRVVDGVGDLLLFGCDVYGHGGYDLQRIEAERERLNKYKVDCIWNTLGATWNEWVSSVVLEPFGIEAVNGPRGVWFREVPWVARAEMARVHLTTDPDAVTGQLGHLVVAADSGISETTEETANRITIAYGQIELSETIYRYQTIVAPYAEVRPDVVDWRFTTHPLATRSALVHLARRRLLPGALGGAEVDGVIARTYTMPQIHDPPTATLLAVKYIQQRALPHQLVRYVGGRELLDLEGYTELLLTDPRKGYDARPALLLPGSVVAESQVAVMVRVPPL